MLLRRRDSAAARIGAATALLMVRALPEQKRQVDEIWLVDCGEGTQHQLQKVPKLNSLPKAAESGSVTCSQPSGAQSAQLRACRALQSGVAAPPNLATASLLTSRLKPSAISRILLT